MNKFVKFCLRTFFIIFKSRCKIRFDLKKLPKKGVYVSYQEGVIDSKKTEIKEFFEHLKEKNVTLKEIKEILNEVYGGKEND